MTNKFAKHFLHKIFFGDVRRDCWTKSVPQTFAKCLSGVGLKVGVAPKNPLVVTVFVSELHPKWPEFFSFTLLCQLFEKGFINTPTNACSALQFVSWPSFGGVRFVIFVWWRACPTVSWRLYCDVCFVTFVSWRSLTPFRVLDARQMSRNECYETNVTKRMSRNKRRNTNVTTQSDTCVTKRMSRNECHRTKVTKRMSRTSTATRTKP